MSTEIIQVGMIDNHTLVRQTLKNYLSQQKKINVIFQASSLDELLGKATKLPLDILLMDLGTPQLNLIDTFRLIRTEYPHLKVIVLSTHSDLYLLKELLDIGILGYISKTDDPKNLLQAIQTVYKNRLYRNRLLTDALYYSGQVLVHRNRSKAPVLFSDKEKKILQLLWEEKSNKEIAAEIFLSVHSIEKIKQTMKEKTGTRSMIGLLKYAHNNEIIRI